MSTETISSEECAQFDRLPPQAKEAEQCTLASMMLDPNCILDVTALVSTEDFYDSGHRVLFDLLCERHQLGKPIDAVLVHEDLTASKQLGTVGGADYLGQLMAMVPSASHAAHYASQVREKSLWRGYLDESYGAVRKVYAAHASDAAAEAIQDTVGRLAALVASRRSAEVVHLADALHETYEAIEAGSGNVLYPLGFDTINHTVGGVAPGEMVVIGARPSMGKSTLGRQMAVRIAGEKCPVALVWLEEGPQKVARNLLSAECRIENSKLRRGRLTASGGTNITEPEMTKLAAGASSLAKLPIYLIPRAFRLNSIRAACAQAVARHGVKVVIVDYLQKVQAPGHNRYEIVTNASMGLSSMFKELNVAGIVLAQLSREVTHRDDKRPTMGDLRESGQIEQDADGIIFLHREDYYHLDESEYTPTGEAELIVAKWRDAVRGNVLRLKSDMRFQRFDDMTVEAF